MAPGIRLQSHMVVKHLNKYGEPFAQTCARIFSGLFFPLYLVSVKKRKKKVMETFADI